MKRKLLSMALALALCLTLLPAAALAAEDHWAANAVTTLNGIYGESVFSADDGTMTVAELNTLMEKTGWKTEKTGSDTSAQLSRGEACEMLADVFALPIGSKSAIQYLYDQNIISGKANGNLAENDPVSKAEFAVLTYRVLNSVGGGKTEAGDTFKPGDDGYFEWMYLAARACVPFQLTQMDTAISEAKLTNVGQNSVADAADDTEGVKSGEALWTAWIARLNTLKDVGWGEESSSKPAYPGNDTNLLAAAKAMVTAYIKAGGSATIFSDVVQGDYQNGGAYYDGVMYLFDQRIVSGQGDGTFGLQELQRIELAVLLYTLDGQTPTGNQNRLDAAKEYVAARDYMAPPADAGEAWWGKPLAPGESAVSTAIATREEAIVAVMKQQQGQKADNVDLFNVNTAVLGRFDDCDSHTWIGIENAEEYVAFAVSRGLVNGTGTSLGLSEGTTRGEIGVLVYRVLIGLDTSKMHDYGQNVQNALGTGGVSAEP